MLFRSQRAAPISSVNSASTTSCTSGFSIARDTSAAAPEFANRNIGTSFSNLVGVGPLGCRGASTPRALCLSQRRTVACFSLRLSGSAQLGWPRLEVHTFTHKKRSASAADARHTTLIRKHQHLQCTRIANKPPTRTSHIGKTSAT